MKTSKSEEQLLHQVDVTVKYVCGAYQTQTIRGQRASSTMSAAEAARRLGQKLFSCEPEVQEQGYHGPVDGKPAKHLVRITRPHQSTEGAPA